MFAIVAGVVVAGLTAALARPASAVLLVPKSQDWAARGIQFYLMDLWANFGLMIYLESCQGCGYIAG